MIDINIIKTHRITCQTDIVLSSKSSACYNTLKQWIIFNFKVAGPMAAHYVKSYIMFENQEHRSVYLKSYNKLPHRYKFSDCPERFKRLENKIKSLSIL